MKDNSGAVSQIIGGIYKQMTFLQSDQVSQKQAVTDGVQYVEFRILFLKESLRTNSLGMTWKFVRSPQFQTS